MEAEYLASQLFVILDFAQLGNINSALHHTLGNSFVPHLKSKRNLVVKLIQPVPETVFSSPDFWLPSYSTSH